MKPVMAMPRPDKKTLTGSSQGNDILSVIAPKIGWMIDEVTF